MRAGSGGYSYKRSSGWVKIDLAIDPSMYKYEKNKLLENCFIRDMPKASRKLDNEILHLFQSFYAL